TGRCRVGDHGGPAGDPQGHRRDQEPGSARLGAGGRRGSVDRGEGARQRRPRPARGGGGSRRGPGGRAARADAAAGRGTGGVPAVERWDAWRAIPSGRDARDRKIDLPLVWTSLLVGAIPRQGKTFAARLAAAGLILDPHTRLYVADFKAGKDWDAPAAVAHR